jgi:pimeloyl-ACP methyl ester carboxylesterase
LAAFGDEGEVALVGHSMGGLVARAAVLLAVSKDRDSDREFLRRIAKVIAVGTPQLGSSVALRNLMRASVDVPRGLNRFLRTFLGGSAPLARLRLTMRCRAMPSAWDLLPPNQEQIMSPRQPSDPDIGALQWPMWSRAVPKSAARSARRLHRLIGNLPRTWPPNIECHVVYSQRYHTANRFVFESQPPHEIDLSAPFLDQGMTRCVLTAPDIKPTISP